MILQLLYEKKTITGSSDDAGLIDTSNSKPEGADDQNQTTRLLQQLDQVNPQAMHVCP